MAHQSDVEPQLAIIREPRFGVDDRGHVALSFHVYVTESSAALQVFESGKGCDIIAEYGVRDVHELAGKPCWVRIKGNRIDWAGAWSQ